MSTRTAAAGAIAVAILAGFAAGRVSAAPDDNISVRATIVPNRAFRSPGSGLSSVYLATPSGRICLMADSDNALMAWMVRHETAEIVITLVQEKP